MTTTVVSMEETIKMLREKKPDCKVMVGGAVLNQEYADMIGADFMGKMRCSPYITPKRFLKMRCKKVPIKKNKYLSEKEYSVVDNDFVNRYI